MTFKLEQLRFRPLLPIPIPETTQMRILFMPLLLQIHETVQIFLHLYQK